MTLEPHAAIRGQVEINASNYQCWSPKWCLAALTNLSINMASGNAFEQVLVSGSVVFEHVESVLPVRLYARDKVVVRNDGSLILKVKGDQRALSALESAELHVPSLIVEVGGTLEIVGAASLLDVLNVSGTLKARGE